MPETTRADGTPFPGLAKLDGAAYEGKVAVVKHDAYEIRRVWHEGEWWFSVADVIGALVESKGTRATTYWRVMKKRLVEKEGADQVVSECNQLKIPAADGKRYSGDCANIKTLLRLIQSVSSPRAEPIKQFLAQAGQEKLEEIAAPSSRTDELIQKYRRVGRTDRWINTRMQNISTRNAVTDEWTVRGVVGPSIGALTAEMHTAVFHITPAQHRDVKNLKKSHDARNHMDELELTLVTLSEQAATAFMVERDTQNFAETHEASMDAAKVAGAAAKQIEEKLGRPVANRSNFLPAPKTPKVLSDKK